MFKSDLICVWPDTVDFPLFRQWVHEERGQFEKVIIVFTKTNWPFTNLTDWIEEVMKHDNISFVHNDPVESRDWRDVAVKKALSISDNYWVFFTEPDFFPNKNLWEELKHMAFADIIGVLQDNRLHPCCIFIKRSVLDQTSKDFSANPPHHDHFGQIQKDLANCDPLPTAFTINPKFYYHMNGLTHNMMLMQSDKAPVYMPEEFKEYLQKCLQSSLQLHPGFRQLAEEYLQKKK